MSLGKDILKKIKINKIEPKSKWIFIIKNIIIWIVGILSLIISSLSVSVIIYIIENNDYLFFKLAHPSPFKLIMASLPYFWILGMVIFVIIFRYTLKQVKGAYKIETYKIIIISILLSIILGIFFHNQGIGFSIDNSFSKKSPIYKKMMFARKKMWTQEKQGILSGRIISVIDQNNFDLEDFNKKIWRVIKVEDKIIEQKFKKMSIPKIDIEPGLKIKVLGEKIDENNFKAFIIKSFSAYPRKKGMK
ncbi:MAG: hypothetical protein ACTSUG_17620 [Candidatus Helarchaeota archaeon]